MAEKKVSLTTALAGRPPRAEPEAPAPAPAPGAPTVPPARHPGRERKVNVAAWFPPVVKYGLQELALERSRALGRKVTLQDLMAEAFNDLFKKYGKAETAPSRDH